MQSSHQLSLLKSHICSTMFCTVSKYMFCHGTEHMVCHIPLSTGTYILPCSAKCRSVQDYIFFHVPDTGACLQWLPVCIHAGRIHSPLPGCSQKLEPQEFICHRCSRHQEELESALLFPLLPPPADPLSQAVVTKDKRKKLGTSSRKFALIIFSCPEQL